MQRRIPLSVVVAATLVVANGTTAVAQTTSGQGVAPTPAAPKTQCPAVHMLLAPGTSETSRFAEPNQDSHGFLSRDLARPVMDATNSGALGDLSSGFASLLKLPPGMETLSGSGGHDSVSSSSSSAPARVSRTYITYPATVGGAQPPGMQGIPANAGDLTAYTESVRTGIGMTEDLMSSITESCPDTKLFLSGFSQGAEVISNVARRIGAGDAGISPDGVAGVALFADPTRSGGTPLQPNGAAAVGAVPGTDGRNVRQAVSGLDRMPTANAGGLSPDKTGIPTFGSLSDRVVSWCLPGDYVCGLPVESKLVRDVVKELEGMSLGDPVAALERLARILDRAVRVGDLSEVANLAFGGTGFSTRPDGAAPTPVLVDRVKAAKDSEGSSTTSSTDTTTATGTTTASESMTATGTTTASGSTALATTTTAVGATTPTTTSSLVQGPPSGGAPPPVMGIPPLPSPDQVVRSVVDVAAGLGGMALGAGITVVRKTLTPSNLAQIAVAGVTAGPQAAGTVAMAKLSESAMTLLEPGSASGYARQALQVLKDAGVPVPEQVELAVSLSAWLSTNEHNAYAERAAMPDGRSPAKATTDWVRAIAEDVTAGTGDALAPAPRSTPTGRSALDTVEFDGQAAHAALAGLGGGSTASSAATGTSSSLPATTSLTSTTTTERN